MKVGPDVALARWQQAALSLGHHLQKMDDQRNIRACTLSELEDFCFAELRRIDLAFRRKQADAAVIAAANINVTPFDDPT